MGGPPHVPGSPPPTSSGVVEKVAQKTTNVSSIISTGLTHWKSTVSGILTITLVVTGYLATNPQGIPEKWIATAAGVQGFAKFVIAWLSTDGIQVAIPPNTTVQQNTTTTIETPKG